MKKEHLCPVSFKHPFLTGWPPWEPEQWQQRVGLLTLKVGSIWMKLIWGCWHCGCSEAWFAFHTKPNSRFNRMSEARYVKGCRYNWFLMQKWTKKLTRQRSHSQSWARFMRIAKKIILAIWRYQGFFSCPLWYPNIDTIINLINPHQLVKRKLTFSYSLYWYHFCTMHNTLNEFGFPALSWSNFLQLIYLCIYPHTFITISYHFIIFHEHSILSEKIQR